MFIDEADYFEPSVNTELLHSITAYEEKTTCTTIMAIRLIDRGIIRIHREGSK